MLHLSISILTAQIAQHQRSVINYERIYDGLTSLHLE